MQPWMTPAKHMIRRCKWNDDSYIRSLFNDFNQSAASKHQAVSKILWRINWSVVIWAGYLHHCAVHLILFPSVRWKSFSSSHRDTLSCLWHKGLSSECLLPKKMSWVWEDADNIKHFEGKSFEISATLHWNPSEGSMAVAIFWPCFPAANLLCKWWLQSIFYNIVSLA